MSASCYSSPSPSPSIESGTSFEPKRTSHFDTLTGTHKVKYQPEGEWDFTLDTAHNPLDVSLVLPHYRARNQPVGHRMSMYVSGQSASMKLKVCRTVPRTNFYLEVQSSFSENVTIYLPSDFKGCISTTGRVTFSAGFTNRIMHNIRLNEAASLFPDDEEYYPAGEDEVIVDAPRVCFRMWDVTTCAPESRGKETLRRVFSSTRSRRPSYVPDKSIDWDFLLED